MQLTKYGTIMMAKEETVTQTTTPTVTKKSCDKKKPKVIGYVQVRPGVVLPVIEGCEIEVLPDASILIICKE
ncbi:MAG TPA: hypothetical protein VMU27_01675 [Candidatus Paceibacterota bacterium]|nr:hypothetical protein [Candidatus Paceibacterota bacterium]